MSRIFNAKRFIFSFERNFSSFHVYREMNNNNSTKMKDWDKLEFRNWISVQAVRSENLVQKIIKKGKIITKNSPKKQL